MIFKDLKDLEDYLYTGETGHDDFISKAKLILDKNNENVLWDKENKRRIGEFKREGEKIIIVKWMCKSNKNYIINHVLHIEDEEKARMLYNKLCLKYKVKVFNFEEDIVERKLSLREKAEIRKYEVLEKKAILDQHIYPVLSAKYSNRQEFESSVKEAFKKLGLEFPNVGKGFDSLREAWNEKTPCGAYYVSYYHDVYINLKDHII